MFKLFHKFSKPGAHLNGLPVLNATLTDDADGMLRISLVDYPAVESDFLAFKAAKEAASYRVLDEDRRLVYGVVMRADFPIYRCDPQNGAFYIVYTKETVRKMAEKYLADGRQNNVNIMHLAGSDQEGIRMVQWFLKDTAAGVDPAGFEAIEDGSLFAEFHVENDEVWAAIKDGTYRGFSIEVINGLTPATEDFRSLVFGILNDSKLTDMFKLKKIKELADKALAKFRSITTDKGVLSWDGDEDPVVGTKVYVPGEGENAERQPAPDGDYKLEDGTTYVVAGGEVTEIKAAEGETIEGAGEPDPNADPEERTADERIAALEEENRELREEIEGLEDVIETVINRLQDLGVQFKKFKKEPAADPAKKRFKAQAAPQATYKRLKEILG